MSGILGRILHSCFYKKSPSPTEQWKKGPWLFRVYRGIYILPSYVRILKKPWNIRIPSLNNQYFHGIRKGPPGVFHHQNIKWFRFQATEATVPSFTRWNYYSFPGVRNGLALIARPKMGRLNWGTPIGGWCSAHMFFLIFEIYPWNTPCLGYTPPPRMPVTTRIFRCLGSGILLDLHLPLLPGWG